MQSTHARDSEDGLGGSCRSASVLATCTHCERLHHAEPLQFNPVCAICAAERATMRTLGMRGSYALSHEAIAAELTRTSPGNFALGYLEDDRFVVFYVGRSDTDLRQGLRSWVGTPSRYERYAPSGMAAFRTRPRTASPLDTPALGRVGCAGATSYTHFAYSYASSPETALEKELRNFDDFGGCDALDNERAPGLDGADGDPTRRF